MGFSTIRRSTLTPIGNNSGDAVVRGGNGSIDIPIGGVFTIDGAAVLKETSMLLKEGAAPAAVASKIAIYHDSSDASLKAKKEQT